MHFYSLLSPARIAAYNRYLYGDNENKPKIRSTINDLILQIMKETSISWICFLFDQRYVCKVAEALEGFEVSLVLFSLWEIT